MPLPVHCLKTRRNTKNKEGGKSTYVRQLVEASEELVEESDELLRRALRRQDCEAHDVREDHAARRGTNGLLHAASPENGSEAGTRMPEVTIWWTIPGNLPIL